MKAFVFPGQGSQFPGMGKDLWENFSEARRVFEEADDVLSFPLSRLCFEGPSEELVLTENTQPAVLTCSVAVLRILEAADTAADLVAGHSLGEYSALVCAGSLRFSDALRVVRERGRLMQEAVPIGTGSMAAVLGLTEEDVRQVCAEAAEDEIVSPANLNAPDQIVIAGHSAAVERASHLATEKGARRVVLLPVSAPFHCELMSPAREALSVLLDDISIEDSRVPVVNNADARPLRQGEEIRDSLKRQVTSAVRWNDCVLRFVEMGVTTAFEVGPGKVLSGLIRRIDRSLQVQSVGTLEQVKEHV